MAETTVLTEAGYVRLVRDIRKLIEEGKRRAESAARQELVATYWNMGKRIAEEKLIERGGYGDSIVEDLSRDLDIPVTTLRSSVLFFEQRKIHPPRGMNLTWSHYRALLGVHDGEERRFYERHVLEEGWTRDELVSAIRRGEYEDGEQVRKTKKTLKRPTEATYVYSAMVERAVDGDTVILRIDLGFQVWKEQRIRLAGIDCPEKDTPLGRKAYEYVRDRMARAEVIMVKTNKIDIYGRYVGHVFYSFEKDSKEKVFAEGRYLNQELVSKGLAKVI